MFRIMETHTDTLDLSGDELLKLRDVAASSKLGVVDQGQPRRSSQLEAKGLLEKVGPGWKITRAGLELLKTKVNELKAL